MFLIKKQLKSMYEILNVPSDASEKEIKQAYRKMANLYHPDKVRNSDDPDLKSRAEREMIKINSAKEILLNPEKRSEYDLHLAELSYKLENDDHGYIENFDVNNKKDNYDIDWDLDSSSHDDSAGENLDYTPWPLEQEVIYQPATTWTPPYDHMFDEISQRFLTFCPTCGTENIRGSPYCEKCNSCLIFPPPPQTSRPYSVTDDFKHDYQSSDYVECPICGAKNLNSNEHCYSCSANLRYYPVQKIYEEIPKPVNNNLAHSEASTHASEEEPYWIFECPHCGAENPENSPFCKSCFKNLF